MCTCCRCPDVCNCNGPCCCGFKIPIDDCYILCSVWLLVNGFSFPVVSFAFWPRFYIFCVSCIICGLNFVLAVISFVNFFYKSHRLFGTVVYGTIALYVAGGIFVTAAVEADPKGNSALLSESLRTLFGASVHPSVAFGLLQSIQILYYFYLFVACVYCGSMVQRFDVVHGKK